MAKHIKPDWKIKGPKRPTPKVKGTGHSVGGSANGGHNNGGK